MVPASVPDRAGVSTGSGAASRAPSTCRHRRRRARRRSRSTARRWWPPCSAAHPGATFALLAGDARYLLVCVVMAAGSVGLSLLVRHRAVQAHRRSDARAREAYLRVVDAAVREAAAAASRQRAATSKPRTRECRPMPAGSRTPRPNETSPRTRRQSPGRAASGSAPARVRPRPPSGSRRRRRRTTRAPSLRSRRRSPRWQPPVSCTVHPSLSTCWGYASSWSAALRRRLWSGAGLGGGARRDPPAGSTGAGRRRRPRSRAAVVGRLGVGAVAPAHRWALARPGDRRPHGRGPYRRPDAAPPPPPAPARSPGPCRRTGRGGRRAARPDSGPVTRHHRAGGGPGRRDRCRPPTWSCTWTLDGTCQRPPHDDGAHCHDVLPDRMSAGGRRPVRAHARAAQPHVRSTRAADGPVRLGPLLAAVEGHPALRVPIGADHDGGVVDARPAGERRGRQRPARRPGRGDRVRQVRAAAVAGARARRTRRPSGSRSACSWTTRAAPPSTRCGRSRTWPAS